MTLIGNILGNHLISYIAATAAKVAARPRVASPELLLQMQELPQPLGGNSRLTASGLWLRNPCGERRSLPPTWPTTGRACVRFLLSIPRGLCRNRWPQGPEPLRVIGLPLLLTFVVIRHQGSRGYPSPESDAH